MTASPLSAIIRVDLSATGEDRSYDIEIGHGQFDEAGERIGRQIGSRSAIIISDSNVVSLYGDRLRDQWPTDAPVHVLSVPSGESSKSIKQAEWLWNQVLSRGADRNTVIIALGGGVVGDLAGFIAATFARGLPLVQIPTTLLAQVDSSVGGKVAINLPGAKNIVGAFWQPQLVLIDVNLLATLPAREYAAGMAEVIKYGVIADADFFHSLESRIDAILARDRLVLASIVARCCEIKSEIVREDERETTGRRAILNYGHTFGHAIESHYGYAKYNHGEAIAIGMMCAARLGQSLGMVDGELVGRQQQLFTALGLPTKLESVEADKLLAAMRHDKKSSDGKIRLILPTCLGGMTMRSDIRDELIIEEWNRVGDRS